MTQKKVVLGLIFSLWMFNSVGAAPQASYALIWPELLKEANLQIVWQTKLPIKTEKNEILEQLYLVDGRLIANSSKNFMTCLNSRTGDVLFAKMIASENIPIHGMTLYDDMLVSVIGHKLTEINADLGTVISSVSLGFGVVCPPVKNGGLYYIGASDRRVKTFQASDKVKRYDLAAENESVITSVVEQGQWVYFATGQGNLICLEGGTRNRLWQFDTLGGAIVEPVAIHGDSLVFASKDTYVYKISRRNKSLDWKYQTAAVLDKAPRVTDHAVYQYVDRSGFDAIDYSTGKLKWHLDDGLDLLAEYQNKAYVLCQNGKMTVMDNTSDQPVLSMNIAAVNRHVSNTMDEKIYLADTSGRIVCLKPIE